MDRIFTTCAIVLLAATQLAAEETLPPANQRFAAHRVEETPDFQRHVLPLLGRLGCNGRECHGSFQGQGGFRLSLFGYDFAADHASLLEEGQGRVDREAVADSLILQKPTRQVEHKGGERFKADGWEYRLLRRWIEAGAPNAAGDRADFVALEIEPREIVFAKENESTALKAMARWSDGTREDVTPLCRFRSNDESIATVSHEGVLTAKGKGDGHVVVFYDNGIAPVPVILPVSDAVADKYPSVPAPTKVDELVVQKLRKVGIIQADLCTDAEFLRRVSLDMTGTLPTPMEIEAFLADTAPDKRAAKVDELLARPTYAAWWTTKLCDLLGNSEQNLPVGGEQGLRREKSAQWYDWIYRRIENNTPYDKLVEGIVLGRSRQAGQSVADYCGEMSAYFRADQPADFAARETLPYFWTRGRFTPPQPLRFSYAFLGIRLECAQCHKHPYDQWTKSDYDGFQAFFDGVGQNYGDRKLAEAMKKELGLTADQDSGGYKKLFADLATSGKTVPWQEVSVSSLEKQIEKARRPAKSGGRVFAPRLLGEDELAAGKADDCRAPLMQWLRERDNPYFARALVNRVWANYFGVGIVEPPDDMNLANPPSNDPLLRYLAEQFIERGFDLKWLHREILLSRTYQLSWRPNSTNERDERNFSHALVRRLPAELVYDAVTFINASHDQQQLLQTDPASVRGRAIGVVSGQARFAGNYATRLFGKPLREGICDCDRSSEPALLQTIYLRNDAEVLGQLSRKDGWLSQVAKCQDESEEALIRQAYLRVFSRPPNAPETTFAQEYLQSAENRAAGLRDVLWALLNSKEFLLNH
jgi:hypothetical protein